MGVFDSVLAGNDSKFSIFFRKSQKMKVFKKHINLILMSLLSELRALRGYNILLFGCIKYFFAKTRNINFINKIISIYYEIIDLSTLRILDNFFSRNQGIFSKYETKFS